MWVRSYQCEAGLWWWTSQWPGLYPGPFQSARTNGDPWLRAEEVTNLGEIFEVRRVGKGSYLPLFLIFILLFIVTS
jgi:hypothetical protein